MRILRCVQCRNPCMLTTRDDGKIEFCPMGKAPAEWKQVNKTEPAGCEH